MEGLKRLGGRLRGVRGIEWLALVAALSLLGLALIRGNTITLREDARTDLERRMEDVLGNIAGAGKVRVLVTEQASESHVYQPGDADQARVQGVLIVAEGAGSLRVRLELERAVRALLDVELADIEIVEMRRN